MAEDRIYYRNIVAYKEYFKGMSILMKKENHKYEYNRNKTNIPYPY